MKVRLAATAAALLGAAAIGISTPDAADHAEAPGTQADPVTDIADLYAWVDSGTLTAIVTFNPLIPALGDGGAPVYDDEALYEVHVDTNADGVADETVSVRFGQNGASDWGVQATFGLSATTVLEGPVETTITGSGNKVWAGLADDPFFFDYQGFTDTLATATIAFDGTRDFFAGRNVMVIAVELPASGTIDVWATTGRE